MIELVTIAIAATGTDTGTVDARLATDLPSGAALMANLLLVIAAIVFAAWLVARLRRQLPGNGEGIRIIASHALGHRDRIVVLAIGDEQIVVGIGAQGMVRLHQLNTPLVENAAPASGSFLSKLREARDEVAETSQ